jgi:hypothetical protein
VLPDGACNPHPPSCPSVSTVLLWFMCLPIMGCHKGTCYPQHARTPVASRTGCATAAAEALHAKYKQSGPVLALTSEGTAVLSTQLPHDAR